MSEPSEAAVLAAAGVLCEHYRLAELCLDQSRPCDACTEKARTILRAAAAAVAPVESL